MIKELCQVRISILMEHVRTKCDSSEWEKRGKEKQNKTKNKRQEKRKGKERKSK